MPLEDCIVFGKGIEQKMRNHDVLDHRNRQPLDQTFNDVASKFAKDIPILVAIRQLKAELRAQLRTMCNSLLG